MADHQRIYPVRQDPQAPLVNGAYLRSDNGDPEQQQTHNHSPPRTRTAIPQPQEYTKPARRNWCCKCLCWLLCILILIIIILAALAAVIYFVFQPKIPKYSIDSMRVTQFDLHNDMSLSATFEVNVTANNPNKKIGIYYKNGSSLKVYYLETELCQGSLPEFFQDQRNITELSLDLTGQTRNATGLLQSLQVQQQQTGSIPLNIKAKVPVKIKLGSFKLMKWNCLVKCLLDVDSLAADNVIRIKNSSCKFRFKL